jgi:tetratricopeptide (TPR) repeat protein
LRVNETIGDLWVRAVNSVFVLGDVALELKDYAEAERQFEIGLRWFKEIGQLWGIGASYQHLDIVALAVQDYAKAKYWLQEGLRYLKESGQHYQYGELLYHVGNLLVAQQRIEEAVELLSLVQQQGKGQNIRVLATAALAELQAALPRETYTATVERGKALDVDAAVEELLQDL